MKRFAPVLLLAVAGCSGGLQSNSSAEQIYVMRPTNGPNTALQPLDVVLRVGRPQAQPGLDTPRIVLIQSDRRMSHFQGSRWPEDVPEMLEALTVETFRNTNALRGVQDSLSPFAGDYFLQLSVRRFEADYSRGGVAPEVRIVLDCTVGARRGRETLVSFVAEGTAPAADNRLGAVVAAFETATNTALATVTQRTFDIMRETIATHAKEEADIAARGGVIAPPAQNVERPAPSMRR